jgi:hypothetical protein
MTEEEERRRLEAGATKWWGADLKIGRCKEEEDGRANHKSKRGPSTAVGMTEGKVGITGRGRSG